MKPESYTETLASSREIAASPSVALLLQWHTEVEYRTDFPVSYSLGVFAMPVNVFSQSLCMTLNGTVQTCTPASIA